MKVRAVVTYKHVYVMYLPYTSLCKVPCSHACLCKYRKMKIYIAKSTILTCTYLCGILQELCLHSHVLVLVHVYVNENDVMYMFILWNIHVHVDLHWLLILKSALLMYMYV